LGLHLLAMDDLLDEHFRVRVGRIRDGGGAATGRATRITLGRLARRGRGQGAVGRLRQAAARSPRLRRVIVKARIVRLKAGSSAVRAHLAYLERDAPGRDGERGRLYSATQDRADGRAFIERGEGDRHHFRFIVSPEDGEDLDLRRYTRELMRRMEDDLGTLLDWVAVDHTDTAHPHSHILIRGKAQTGKDLLISQDYLTEGLRLRAREVATEQLGLATEQEREAKLRREVGQDRFTRIDRGLLREVWNGVVDLRPGSDLPYSDFGREVRTGRLQVLERQGLARQLTPGVWSLSADLESELRRRGERGDIIRAMNRALARRGETRQPESFVTHDEERIPIIGRLIDKGLAGPTEERAALIVDGVDGRVRRVEVSLQASANLGAGAIVQTGEGATLADHTIDEIAGDSRVYRTEEHFRRLATKELPMPEGAAPADVVASHVRRLEALRRARVVQRYDAEHWKIPPDFLDRASAYEQRRGVVRVISQLDLEAQIASRGATWLDRQLVAREPATLAETGFGQEVRSALARRAEVLVERGLGQRTAEGVRFQRGLINALVQIEVGQAGEAYARAAGRHFRPAAPGSTVQGRYREKLQLDSGTFAAVETRGLGFALVPWRPVIEKQLGKEVTARIEIGGGIEWEIGRRREIGLPGF
jgi:type IV secretory pathway VirD2 relaxase